MDNKKIPMKTWSPCIDQLKLIYRKAKACAEQFGWAASHIFQAVK